MLRRDAVASVVAQSNCVVQLNVPLHWFTRFASWPFCQFTIWLLAPLAPPVNRRLLASTGVVMFSDVSHLSVPEQTWSGKGAGWGSAPTK